MNTDQSQLFFFVFGTYPFDSDVEDMVVVEQMIDLLGELPQEWQPTWDRMRAEAGDMMDFQGEISQPVLINAPVHQQADLQILGDEVFTLEDRFDKEVAEPELAPLIPIIRALLEFRPSERITAPQALGLLGTQGQ